MFCNMPFYYWTLNKCISQIVPKPRSSIINFLKVLKFRALKMKTLWSMYIGTT